VHQFNNLKNSKETIKKLPFTKLQSGSKTHTGHKKKNKFLATTVNLLKTTLKLPI